MLDKRLPIAVGNEFYIHLSQNNLNGLKYDFFDYLEKFLLQNYMKFLFFAFMFPFEFIQMSVHVF